LVSDEIKFLIRRGKIMENSYQVIDEINWKRALHCQIFRNSVEPSYCVTFELDITNFFKKVKAKKFSFTFSLIFLVTQCANKIEEFRYRFLDGQIVLYDQINTAFTYLDKDTELFKVVNVRMQDSLEEYVALAAKTAQLQKNYFTGPLGNDVFQFSPMPWVSYTHISHTNSGKKDNATPLFDWGKYFERDGKILLPFSVQVHHSFVDGIHIGKLVDSLQNCLDTF
jgi:chloramphenicol O-acetyltransferase type B